MKVCTANAPALTRVRQCTGSQSHNYNHHYLKKQYFLTASAPQSFTLTRTIPYATRPVYDIIADVSSYASFIPYCSSSAVTSWSLEDASGQTWPTKARIAISWRGLSEEWSSQLHCEPERIVEAVTNIPASTSAEAGAGAGAGAGLRAMQAGFRASSAIKSLKARWTLKPMDVAGKEQQQTGNAETKALLEDRHVPQDQKTMIKLEIEYAFTNALYEAMGAAFAPKVAGLVVEAFEKRARSLLGNSQTSK